MKKIMILGLTTVVAFTASAASARQGCGRDFHRDREGFCRRNFGGPAVVVGPSIGVFYGGRGWWDGRRYWRDRYRFHGGWRYR